MSNLERHVVVDAREERPAQCALQAVSAPPRQPQRAGARHCAAAQRQRTDRGAAAPAAYHLVRSRGRGEWKIEIRFDLMN